MLGRVGRVWVGFGDWRYEIVFGMELCVLFVGSF